MDYDLDLIERVGVSTLRVVQRDVFKSLAHDSAGARQVVAGQRRAVEISARLAARAEIGETLCRTYRVQVLDGSDPDDDRNLHGKTGLFALLDLVDGEFLTGRSAEWSMGMVCFDPSLGILAGFVALPGEAVFVARRDQHEGVSRHGTVGRLDRIQRKVLKKLKVLSSGARELRGHLWPRFLRRTSNHPPHRLVPRLYVASKAGVQYHEPDGTVVDDARLMALLVDPSRRLECSGEV